ncbi:MAG: flagellin [Candidatus Adiutrix sp.]|jgi:flagellin-like hook-associated protein FlgL|nr:flagellin [Candidatus Adiutrix sp.]
MSLTINHNMMASDTQRRLNLSHARLAVNTQRLASGLRLNGPVDGPAAFAVREMMRSDMSTLQQSLRNAADGVSLLQTAEGAMAVIDEKLIRMRELAEQAATGTYTTVQREIINSEYQAMAAEIDRIANATNFNGVKLLDGSISDSHHGLGLKIHFGLTDNPAEDYHFVQIGDVRATTATGLRVAGDARNAVWGNTTYADNFKAEACCGGGVSSLSAPVDGWRGGDVFSFGYNWDMGAASAASLTRGRYIAGAWAAKGDDFTLGQLLDQVNSGTQARVRVDIKDPNETRYEIQSSNGRPIDITAYYEESKTVCPRDLVIIGDIPVEMSKAAGMFELDDQLVSADMVEADAVGGFRLKLGTPVAKYSHAGLSLDGLVEGDPEAHAFQFSFGDEVYFYGSASLVRDGLPEEGFSLTRLGSGQTFHSPASALAAAINGKADSRFWARVEEEPGFYRDGYLSVYVFCKESGDKSCLEACDKALGLVGNASRVEDLVMWFNDETGQSDNRSVVFNNGGKYWGVLTAQPNGYGSWALELTGQDLGTGRDLKILNMGDGADLDLGSLAGRGFGLRSNGGLAGNLSGLDSAGFVELRNADDGDWAGAHLRTQSHAQEALEALTLAIRNKEKIRTSLGAYMNRLENTMNHLEITMINLQTAESSISDVDVAREMTDFVRNQVLTQTGISLLSQSNSLPQMTLALLNG